MTRRSAFTLTELLITLALLALIAAMSVPAFNVLAESNALESSDNILTSYVSAARSTAIQTGEPRGVYLYLDHDTERVAIVLVRYLQQQDLTPDSYRYKGWFVQDLPYRSGDDTNETNDHVLGLLTSDSAKPFVRLYRCKLTAQPNATQAGPPPTSSYWGTDIRDEIELDGDIRLLPSGVGAQLCTGTQNNATNPATDRFVSAGAILFNPDGSFRSSTVSIKKGTHLADAVSGGKSGFSLLSSKAPGNLYCRSYSGVAFYHLNAFKDQSYSFADMASAQDPFNTDYKNIGTPSDEGHEEDWILENARIAQFGRSSGQRSSE